MQSPEARVSDDELPLDDRVLGIFVSGFQDGDRACEELDSAFNMAHSLANETEKVERRRIVWSLFDVPVQHEERWKQIGGGERLGTHGLGMASEHTLPKLKVCFGL